MTTGYLESGSNSVPGYKLAAPNQFSAKNGTNSGADYNSIVVSDVDIRAALTLAVEIIIPAGQAMIINNLICYFTHAGGSVTTGSFQYELEVDEIIVSSGTLALSQSAVVFIGGNNDNSRHPGQIVSNIRADKSIRLRAKHVGVSQFSVNLKAARVEA